MTKQPRHRQQALPLQKKAQSRQKRTHDAQPIRLSPTTGLNLFLDCPRCFYYHHFHKVQRPRGIFPSLPGGMDLVIKEYFDHFRGSLPPELRGKVEGCLLEDRTLLHSWRNWRTGLAYTDQKRHATLFGALDDCGVADGLYVPLDYKTKGSAPNQHDSERYYQLQLDTYALLLKKNGYAVAPYAYLIYYTPVRVQQGGMVQFAVTPMKIATNPKRAQDIFHDAVDLLRSGRPPARHAACEYCLWNNRLRDFD
jgi:hypothetical protein